MHASRVTSAFAFVLVLFIHCAGWTAEARRLTPSEERIASVVLDRLLHYELHKLDESPWVGYRNHVKRELVESQGSYVRPKRDLVR
ncbi:unnamed protein product [Echinostoma caproni]|uniref:Uncharacterized protein n=1 Tax=Echinostoma caproni TaxID=27848 RepID=A0A182ZZP4_9TREM|nr:unnamed protein product [Echinostoma caproni]